MTRSQKYLSNKIRDSILVRCVIDGDNWLHGLAGVAVSYISDIHFELLDAGDTTKFIRGMIFFTWCIVKLDCYVDLCSACNILNVANDIRHMGIKMIS